MNPKHSLVSAGHFLSLLVFLVLIGCVSGADSIQTEPVETPGAATPQPTNTSVPATPARTLTTTAPPATATPLPTATLTSEQEAANLAELMKTNGGCDLPCWWGIVLKETQFELASQNLLEKGFLLGDDDHARIRVRDFVISVGFEIEDSVVRSIDVKSDKVSATNDGSIFENSWQRYSLTEVLDRYGPPTRVLVYGPFRPDPGGGPSYHFLMFYDDLGFEIEYRGSAEQRNGNRYRACPDLADIWEIGLFLYQPGQVDNVMERVLPSDSIDYIAGPETVYELISWQEATGTSLESFYESFSAPDSAACFEFTTPWP